MGKFLVTVILLLGIAVGAAVFVINQFGGPEIKETIEVEGGKAIEGRVRVGAVKLTLWPPVSAEITNVVVEREKKPKTQATIPRVHVQIDIWPLVTKRVVARVTLERPQIKIEVPVSSTVASVSKHASQGKADRAPRELRFPGALNVVMQNADLEVVQGQDVIHARDTKLDFLISDFKGVMNLRAETKLDVSTQAFKGTSIPLTVDSGFTFADETFQTPKTIIGIGGFETAIKGSYYLPANTHAWQADVDIPDLAAMSTLPAFMPQGKWTGTVRASVKVEKKKDSDWNGLGSVKILDLKGTGIAYKKDGTVLAGDLSLASDIEFEYDKTLKVDTALVHADLNNLAIEIPEKLNKPKGVPFNANIKAVSQDEMIFLKTFNVSLATLNLAASGKVHWPSTGVPGVAKQETELAISLPKTNLAGLEKYFPALASSPLTGAAQFQGYIKGDFNDPKTMTIEFNPLSLENVRAVVKWTSPDKTKSLNGPVALDGRVILGAQGPNITAATVKGKVDLTAMNIEVADQMKKKAGVPLVVDLFATQKGKAIEVRDSTIKSPAGPLSIGGVIEDIHEPHLDVKFSAAKINVAELSKMFPLVAQWKLAGAASGDVSLQGIYKFADGLEKSPLRLRGKITATLPQFVYKSQPGTKVSEGAAAPAQTPGAPLAAAAVPVLPKWPLTENMQLTTNVKIARLNYNGLDARGVDWAGAIANGVLRGAARVQNVFGGKVSAEKIEMNLLEAEPTTRLTVNAAGTDMSQVVNWISPNWKNLVAGKATGTAALMVPYPSRADFVQAVKASGKLKIANGFLSSLPFDKYINDKLATLPGVGQKKLINSKGAAGNIDSEFSFSDGQLEFKSLHVITPEHNELDGSGYVKLDQTMDLKGRVFLGNAQVTPTILEHNSDGHGRLKLDVHFDGNVFKPETHILDTTLKQLIANTASGEATKFKKQVETKARSEIQNQVDKSKQQILDQGRKKLQNLFSN